MLINLLFTRVENGWLIGLIDTCDMLALLVMSRTQTDRHSLAACLQLSDSVRVYLETGVEMALTNLVGHKNLQLKKREREKRKKKEKEKKRGVLGEGRGGGGGGEFTGRPYISLSCI